MTRLLFILLLLTCSRFSFAQINETNLVNITQQEGLPSNETYCVFKDSKNYMWVATDQGVVRFNGSTMQVINNLPDNVVFKIREDSEGRIWFFSRSFKLACFFNEKVWPFRYNNNLQKKMHGIILLDAYISDSGQIIINTRPFANYKIDFSTGAITEFLYTAGVSEKKVY